MATSTQTVNTPDGFRAEVSQLHCGRARSWRRELLVQKGGDDTWKVPAWLEGVFEDSGAVPPYGWASSTQRRRSDARGLSQHDRASLYLDPRRGKSLSGETVKEQKLLYSVITGCSRRLGKREPRVAKLVSCHECRGT